MKITAYYAPNYEWNTTSKELALTSGKTADTAESDLTTTADAKGNAYFYGTWKANAELAIAFNFSSTDYNLGSKKAADVSANGTSYALDALALPTTYGQVGVGSSDNPYRIYNATQLQNINSATASSDNLICKGQYFSVENDIYCSTSLLCDQLPNRNGWSRWNKWRDIHRHRHQ